MNTGQLIIGVLFIAWGISSFTKFDIFHYFFPALLIFIGIRILTNRKHSYSSKKLVNTSVVSGDDFNEVAVFSASNKVVATPSFASGKAASIFSGMELDLTKAKMKGKVADIELVAVFGGLKLVVPKDWRVVTEGAGVIGGFTNKTENGKNSNKLVVRGAAVFGGVEVVN